MAPRKRRSRTSTVSVAPSAAGSATNSHASSPSSHKHSRSDNDSTDHIVVPSFVPPKTEIAPALRFRIRPLREITAAETAWPSVIHQNSRPEAIEEIDIRSANCLQAYEDAHKVVMESKENESNFTVLDVALRLYEHMIKWAVTEVVVQFKRQAYLAHETKRCTSAFAKVRVADEKGRHEKKRLARVVPGSYGSCLLYSERNVTVVCSNCTSNISASRYAQHVEKCLGRGGRMSSRAASARLRASAERAEKESQAEMDESPPRRRRHTSNGSNDRSADPADMSAFSSGASKRRRMSPVPSVGSTGMSQASTYGRGLPPSGRTRMSPR
ncbi:transcriptional regulation protein Sgf11 [Gracilaria domingensis]|nr:transcriptional regulation protein Sgf11 [Gracilaria domingensis]